MNYTIAGPKCDSSFGHIAEVNPNGRGFGEGIAHGFNPGKPGSVDFRSHREEAMELSRRTPSDSNTKQTRVTTTVIRRRKA